MQAEMIAGNSWAKTLRERSGAQSCQADRVQLSAVRWIVDFAGGIGAEFAERIRDEELSRTQSVDPIHLETGCSAGLSRIDAGMIEEIQHRKWQLIVFFSPQTAADAGCIATVVSRSIELNCLNPQGRIILIAPIVSPKTETTVVSSAIERIATHIRSRQIAVVTIVSESEIEEHCTWLQQWRRFSHWFPLIPASWHTSILTMSEFCSTVDDILKREPIESRRQIVLLGERHPIQEVIASESVRSRRKFGITTIAWVLSWLMCGRLAFWILTWNRDWRKRLQGWRASTLDPLTVAELLAVYHPWNRSKVAIAGYNTGVTHFGWRFPGRTVVRTVKSGRLIRVGPETVTVDAGVLLINAISELATLGKEFFVVPNYSYITLGTAFMVPVHGSGSHVATLGETIERALIYDPHQDRIVLLRRGSAEFARMLYRPDSGILVLRLRFRIRNRSRYFVNESTIAGPTAEQIWNTFADPQAANIELRKSRAADSNVCIREYYLTSSVDCDTLEIPRDSIGRIWDRLEENRIAAWMFHAYVRKWGFHVELFLNRPEFELFWEQHGRLPLAKIQLRFIPCDGMPDSPFGDGDRISIDVFMKRRHSAEFLSFLKVHLPHARFNPGKHSL
jgi:hypothetical protein